MTDEQDQARQGDEAPDAASVEKPTERPPDAGKAYDPSMNVEDEASVPAGSAADAGGDSETERRP